MSLGLYIDFQKMGLVQELNELSPGTKNFIVSISCLMPFWYVCIFIFNPYLFYHSNLYLLMPLCFCFSLLWYIISLVLNGLLIYAVNNWSDSEEEVDESEVIIAGGLDAVIYLSVAAWIAYWSKSKYDAYGIHYHFSSFIKLAFIFSLIRIIIVGGGIIFIHGQVEKDRASRGNENQTTP